MPLTQRRRGGGRDAKPKEQKVKKGKEVAYELILEDSVLGRDMYARMERLIVEHHNELVGARIALAWCTNWKPDADGRLVLGQCKKASDLDKELAPYDFVVLLNRDFWSDLRVANEQRTALLDHELCHATIAYDEDGEPKYDSRGRMVYRIRKHDIEEFSGVVERYGCYKRDLEGFASALLKARASRSEWTGYSKAMELLAKVGVDLPLDAIVQWSDAEREDAVVWARLNDALRARRMPTVAALTHISAAVLAASTEPGVEARVKAIEAKS